MSFFNTKSRERLTGIAEELKLPLWLTQSLAVEYLPCRRFLEGDTWILFDFGLVTVEDLRSLVYPRILPNGITLFHNITPDVLRTRMVQALAGIPMSIVGEGYDFIPEGRVSPYFVPFQVNSTDVEDWKLGLNGYAVVEDIKGLFQWPTGLFAPCPATVLTGGWKSDIFDSAQLEVLFRIQTEVTEIISLPYPGTNKEKAAARQRLEDLYQNLEEVRLGMRNELKTYHESVKSSVSAMAGYTEDAPPILTTFDQVRIRDGILDVRTHIEPLFFRASCRAMRKAEEAKSRAGNADLSAVFVAEEIEASAESITLSAMCLEAYINGVLQDRLAIFDDALEQMDLGAKWLVVPGMLGKGDCFGKGLQPYQDFAILIGWRNKLAHYKHRFQQPKEVKGVGRVSSIYAICNANNARTSVETSRRMIRTLCECLGQPSPRWIDAEESWLYGQKDKSQGT